MVVAVVTAVLASAFASTGAGASPGPAIDSPSAAQGGSLIVAGRGEVDLVSAVTGALQRRLYVAIPTTGPTGRRAVPGLQVVAGRGGVVVGSEGPGFLL